MQTPWWSDPIVLGQIQTVFSILGCLFALVAVFYAWRVATRQFAMMDEQNQASIRQEAIAKRQGEIAEVQHQLLLAQMSVRPVLRVIAGRSYPHDAPEFADLSIYNEGKQSAVDVHFEIRVQHEDEDEPDKWFFDRENVTAADTHEHLPFLAYRGHLAKPLAPGQSVSVLGSHPQTWAPKDRMIEWRIYSPSGEYPADGAFETIDLRWITEAILEEGQGKR